jgi:hypothetical protein
MSTIAVRRPLVAVMALAAALVLLVSVFNVGRAGAADSSVYVVHGIPGVPVDVYVGSTDGDPALPGFEFGDVAGPLSIPAGSLPVFVVAAGQDPSVPANVIITQTLEVPSGANVSVVADLVGGAPVLTPFVNDVSTVPEGSSRVTVRHAADAPPVNVLVNGEVAIPGLASGAQASAVLPAGTYDVQVQLTDGTPLPALSPGSVTIPSGVNVIVYATGSATNETFPLGLAQQIIEVGTTPAPAPTPTTTPAPPAAGGVVATPAVTG